MVQKETDKKNFMNKKIVTQLLVKGKSAISEKIWLKTLKLFFKSFVKNHKKSYQSSTYKCSTFCKSKTIAKKKKDNYNLKNSLI
jgi:hypothetical protein